MRKVNQIDIVPNYLIKLAHTYVFEMCKCIYNLMRI